MNETVFPMHVSQALDRLAVPPLPARFGDRLAARIASGDLPQETISKLPVLRQAFGAIGWRRSGRIMFVAATFGLATATAAAAGVFGDPVYIPVVSQALASAQIVEMPDEKSVSKKQVKAETNRAEPVTQLVAPKTNGKDAVLAAIAGMRADPAYRDLPRRERLERAKFEIDKLLADGTAQKADVEAAWAQLATERNAIDQARLAQGLPVPERRMVKPEQRAKPLTPAQKENVRDAVKQLTDAQRAELLALRQRRREATLRERRAVQDEIRAFWQRVGVEPTAEAMRNAAPEAPSTAGK